MRPWRQRPAAVDPNPSAIDPIPARRYPYISGTGGGHRRSCDDGNWRRWRNTTDRDPKVDMRAENEDRPQQKRGDKKQSVNFHRTPALFKCTLRAIHACAGKRTATSCQATPAVERPVVRCPRCFTPMVVTERMTALALHLGAPRRGLSIRLRPSSPPLSNSQRAFTRKPVVCLLAAAFPGSMFYLYFKCSRSPFPLLGQTSAAVTRIGLPSIPVIVGGKLQSVPSSVTNSDRSEWPGTDRASNPVATAKPLTIAATDETSATNRLTFSYMRKSRTLGYSAPHQASGESS
jgi:hypothetical protein